MGMLITGIRDLVTYDDTFEGADHADGLGIVADAAVIVGHDPETNESSVLWVGRAGDDDDRDVWPSARRESGRSRGAGRADLPAPAVSARRSDRKDARGVTDLAG